MIALLAIKDTPEKVRQPTIQLYKTLRTSMHQRLQSTDNSILKKIPIPKKFTIAIKPLIQNE